MIDAEDGAPPGGEWRYPPRPPAYASTGGWTPAPPPPGGRAATGGRTLLSILTAVLALLVGMAIGTGAMRLALPSSPAAGQSPSLTYPRTAPATNTGTVDPAAIARQVDPAVVNINTVIASIGQSGRAAGTGVILTPSGEVLTNNHVIQGASSIRVTVAGHGTYPAAVVGVDPPQDVAVIQIRGVSGLPTATFADSSRLTIGQPVVALGNALGQGGAPQVTSGTVIGLDRSIFASTDGGRGEQLTGLIESNAPISPGDSGGPLVSSDGQVVGMITAGSSQGPRDATSTDGYAIPSSTTLEVANRIRSGQASDGVILGQPGYLGVAVGDLDAGTASRLGLSAGSGALVEGVAAGSPAARAGIARDAVITAIDGNAVGSSSDLGPAIQTRKPGQQLRVTWLDQTGQHTATVTLAPGPAA